MHVLAFEILVRHLVLVYMYEIHWVRKMTTETNEVMPISCKTYKAITIILLWSDGTKVIIWLVNKSSEKVYNK